MAQTQTPDKLHQLTAQTKKIQSTPDKLRARSSAAQQNGKGRGGIAKKETAKPTSNSSPNYMKPTACSDKRKEPMQVGVQSPAPATVVKAKNHADQSNSKLSPTSSPSLPVAKYLKTLARKASLRPRRPSMKKIYETSVLSPRRKVSRATCSSTMKEFKLPNASEVNPGNKEAELTSAVKVCPFNYCSLHGRRHQHLQPLRRLPSARRRSFRTQRSVKLKRVSSIRRGSFKKGGRSVNSGKMKSIRGSKIAPVVEETNYDFLSEISAKSKDDLRFGRRNHKAEFDREISKFLESLESSEDDTEFSEEEIEGAGTYIEIPEIYARISSGESLEQTSDVSSGDACVAGSILAAESEKETRFCFHENEGDWEYEWMENGKDEKLIEATPTDHDEKAGSFAECSTSCSSDDLSVAVSLLEEAIRDGSHTSTGHSFVADNGGGGNAADNVVCFEFEKSHEESELATVVTSPHHIIFSILADDAERGGDKGEETNGFDRSDEDPENINHSKGVEIDESGSDELEENNISSESQTIEQVLEDESTSEQNGSIVVDDQDSESSNVSDSNKSEQDGFGKAKLGTDDEDDDNSNISNGGLDDRTEGRNAEQSKLLAAAEEWPENKEPEISSGYENPDSSLKLTEEEKVRDGRFIEYQGFWGFTEDSSIQKESDFIDLSEDIYSEDDQTSEHDQMEYKDASDGVIFAAIRAQNGMITNSEEARCNKSPKLSNKQKARRKSVKWKKDIEMEVLRLINPRAQRFLPVEPDPAAETVDLRHQHRDERKSSETWMIDNALQKAVRKLTPARSKKVALLVEAFEAVMSVPIHDLTLKSPT